MSRSIVMVDWSRYNEVTPRTRDQFLWHQMLLSFLYDDVLAQDETIVCSKKLPRWFNDSASFGLFEQMIECGGLSILKRPHRRYPSLALREKALEQPITARREHLEHYSVNNDGRPLSFGKRQKQFHSRLEAVLSRNREGHREAGSKNSLGADMMCEFAKLLATVLTDIRYKKYLNKNFPKLTRRIAHEFASFAMNPSLALDRLRAKHFRDAPKFIPQGGGELTFSTALAVRVAATYEPEEANSLQSLIETVFARPFCQDEGAEGRYGHVLRDLPIPVDDEEDFGVVQDVKVKVAVPVSLSLPSPGPNFADIVERVREKDSAKQLRKAMSRLGHENDFSEAEMAWRAVSDDLASLMHSKNAKKFSVWMLLVHAGRGAACGAMFDLLANPPGTLHDTALRLPIPLAGAFFDVGLGISMKLAQADLERQRISSELQQVVKFACVPHPSIKIKPPEPGNTLSGSGQYPEQNNKG